MGPFRASPQTLLLQNSEIPNLGLIPNSSPISSKTRGMVRTMQDLRKGFRVNVFTEVLHSGLKKFYFPSCGNFPLTPGMNISPQFSLVIVF